MNLVMLALLGALAQSPDPAEGKWLGTAGDAENRETLGLDIHRNAKGALHADLYQPILNVYGAPAHFLKDGDAYSIPEIETKLHLDRDRLIGTMMDQPVVLQRAKQLPSDVAIPSFAASPQPAWQAHLGGMLWAPVAVRDGVAYAGTTSGVFNALQVKDGRIVWTFSAGRPIFGGALVTADAVFFVCDNGLLYRLDRASGHEVWHYDLGDANVPRLLPHQGVFDWDSRSPQPVLADGILYAGSGDGALHAVRADDGRRVWRAAIGDKVRGDALVAGDQVIAGTIDGNLTALRRADGTQVWQRDLKGAVTSTPSLVDGKVVVGTRASSVVVALNPADGATVWRSFYWGSWVESSAVPFGDRLYIGASDMRRVTCHDPKDGHVLWRTDVYGWSWGAPLVTERRVYVGVAGGSPYVIRHVPSLTALDRTTGKIAWRWTPPASPAFQSGFAAGPVLDGSMLVAGALDGTIYGFRLENA
jgi:outer membrane protein assembly factor BamB